MRYISHVEKSGNGYISFHMVTPLPRENYSRLSASQCIGIYKELSVSLAGAIAVHDRLWSYDLMAACMNNLMKNEKKQSSNASIQVINYRWRHGSYSSLHSEDDIVRSASRCWIYKTFNLLRVGFVKEYTGLALLDKVQTSLYEFPK